MRFGEDLGPVAKQVFVVSEVRVLGVRLRAWLDRGRPIAWVALL